jgi:hypothetical protein
MEEIKTCYFPFHNFGIHIWINFEEDPRLLLAMGEDEARPVAVGEDEAHPVTVGEDEAHRLSFTVLIVSGISINYFCVTNHRYRFLNIQ